MHHFFLNEQKLQKNGSYLIKDKNLIHQMLRVLRLRAGEFFYAINNSDYKFYCQLKKLTKQYIFFEVIELIPCAKPRRKIVLAQSLLEKKEKMELVLQKGTEIGVNGFEILQADKTKSKFQLNLRRWRKIIIEAAEQSQRCRAPFLNESIIYLKQIEERYPNFLKIFLDPDLNNSQPIYNIIKKVPAKDLIICVGPEQGWSDFEKDLAKNSGWEITNINDGILRSETAAIAAAAILKAQQL